MVKSKLDRHLSSRKTFENISFLFLNNGNIIILQGQGRFKAYLSNSTVNTHLSNLDHFWR